MIPELTKSPKVGIFFFPELKLVSKNSKRSTEGLSLWTLLAVSTRHALGCNIILSGIDGIDGEHDDSHKES